MMKTDSCKTVWSLAALVVALLVLSATAAAVPIGRSIETRRPGDAARPLKVFILAGQSNMQGHAHVRTFDAMALRSEDGADPRGDAQRRRHAAGLREGVDLVDRLGRRGAGRPADRRLRREARGPKIGPEFTFGITMEKRLDEPILIIKTAWGGKSLHTDFRPPSAGPYEFNEAQLEALEKQGKDLDAIKADAGGGVGSLLPPDDRPREEGPGGHRAGVSGLRPGAGLRAGRLRLVPGLERHGRSAAPIPIGTGRAGTTTYSELLAQFIRDVRKDLSAPSMPFVIGVMGVGGPIDEYPPEQQRYKGIHQNFRMAMAAPAALPEFKGNVVAVPTAEYWDMEVVALRARESTIKPQSGRDQRAR